MSWWRKLSVWRQDVLLAVAALGLVLATQWTVLAAACCVLFALRRRFPLITAAGCAALQLAGALLKQPPVAMLVTLAAIGSAAYCIERGWVVLAAAASAWMVLVMFLTQQSFAWSNLVWAASSGAAPVAFCYALRVQRDRAEQMQEAHALKERARIARDVHDVVGHHLSAIRLQAVGSRKALGGVPAAADQALGTIAEQSSQALDEIRQLLRDDPALGLDDVAELVRRMPGLRIRLLDGRRSELPSEVDYCAYRVVQESLTNVARHADARSVTVHVDCERELVITVDDDGPAPKTGPEGTGLRGMRERVGALGGSLVAGPHEPRGWRVRATIPLREAS